MFYLYMRNGAVLKAHHLIDGCFFFWPVPGFSLPASSYNQISSSGCFCYGADRMILHALVWDFFMVNSDMSAWLSWKAVFHPSYGWKEVVQ